MNPSLLRPLIAPLAMAALAGGLSVWGAQKIMAVRVDALAESIAGQEVFVNLELAKIHARTATDADVRALKELIDAKIMALDERLDRLESRRYNRGEAFPVPQER